ncbi:MAG: hypothetical protein ACRBF0_06985 [Calditrichia bacterium]
MGLGKYRVIFYSSIVVRLLILAPSDDEYNTAKPIDPEIRELQEKKKKKEAEYKSKLSEHDRGAIDKLKEDKVFKNMVRLAFILPILDAIFAGYTTRKLGWLSEGILESVKIILEIIPGSREVAMGREPLSPN